MSAELDAVLARLGVDAQDRLGRGGEASVYALDRDRVLRVLHAPVDQAHLEARGRLLDELNRGDPPFDLPSVEEIGEIGGFAFTIERRLRGQTLMQHLRTARGRARDALIEAHLEATAAIGALPVDRRGWYGELLATEPIRDHSWRGFLIRRADASLSRSTADLQHIDAQALAADLPMCEDPAFVHLDAFAGNMLVDDGRVCAVVDIGATATIGDRRLDPVSAVVYLAASEITPAATPRDVDIATSWLRDTGLDSMLEPARRWLAAYWSFAVTDGSLHEWCRSVLTGRATR